MPSEVRNSSVRSQVAKLLDEAARDLRTGLKRVKEAKELLATIEEAQAKANTAKNLASHKPQGARAVPKSIRQATLTAAARLESLAQRVRETPVTDAEKTRARYAATNGASSSGKPGQTGSI